MKGPKAKFSNFVSIVDTSLEKVGLARHALLKSSECLVSEMKGSITELKKLNEDVVRDNTAYKNVVKNHEETIKINQEKNRNISGELEELKRKVTILKQSHVLATEFRSEHLVEMDDEKAARDLFVRSVEMVEVEVFSYCNRVCWFCPNATHDRRTANHHMDHDLYIKILKDLKSCNYSGMLSYSRYNEPLADRIIVERIREARDYLPNAFLHLNTNGDYLTTKYLHELYDAGLRGLNIQVYLNNEERFEHEKVKNRMLLKLDKLGTDYEIVRDTKNLWIEAKILFRDMKVRMYGRNFEKNGVDRGGTVEVEASHVRTSPCRSPFNHMYIDYNGSVMPCCNVRSDIPQHKNCIIDKLNPTSSIFLTYTNRLSARWRRGLVGFEEKKGVCESCNFAEFIDSPETRKAHEEISAISKALE
ncbi:radical SAM protein [Roseibium algicola]|uniref:radical SAM protein n=1 Tax=Roseibium algicola TaxID=2857014 RepID=UPI003459B815